ncbi:MAG: response regulator transcription factor [Prevotella sp.]|nr:response regulator transcription factor [Prevotella sp.]
MKYKIDVYIVDDHKMFNEGLTDAVNRSETVHVSRCFTTLSNCRAAMAQRCPDVLLLDISMPDGDGTTFCRWAASEYPKVRIVAVTIHDEYHVIQRMLDSGVHGYVLKSAPIDELITAIEQVWKGQRYLSPRVESIIRQSGSEAVHLTIPEQHILRYVCKGCSNPEIAVRLHLSTETVKWYRKRLLAKFGVRNTVALVSLVLKEHVLPDGDPACDNGKRSGPENGV